MQYAQRNPLPLPTGGPFESLQATIDTVFDWQYELRKQNLLNLYEKGKTLAWNANDLDWSIDVNLELHVALVKSSIGSSRRSAVGPAASHARRRWPEPRSGRACAHRSGGRFR